jgi:hypothetical protein
MDLLTVQHELSSNSYCSLPEWKSDVGLLWWKAVLSNGPESDRGLLGRELQSLFEKHSKDIVGPMATDWDSKLSELSAEFLAEVKAVSLPTPGVKGRSFSLNSIASPVSDTAGVPEALWPWEEISGLGQAIL